MAMVIVPIPDAFGALLLHLHDEPYIESITQGRIADEIKDTWGFAAEKGKYAVVVNGPSGGPGDIGLGMIDERYDILVYGPNKRNAGDLARYVRAYLVNPDPTIVNGFQRADTDVRIIREEASPTRLRDPDARWWYVLLPIRIIYDATPIDAP